VVDHRPGLAAPALLAPLVKGTTVAPWNIVVPTPWPDANATRSEHSMEGDETRPLDVQLERVTASLKASLDEACGTDVQRLDTGESVRIEEVLAIASDAAKEVVSIRRKRRQLKKRPRTAGKSAVPTGVEGHRLFVDERGVHWEAFAVLPTTDKRGLTRLPEPYQQGWLCFESATEKRRLGPIPEHWQTASDEELRRMRDSAQPVPHRILPPERRDRL
jgi:hypothetical protein